MTRTRESLVNREPMWAKPQRQCAMELLDVCVVVGGVVCRVLGGGVRTRVLMGNEHGPSMALKPRQEIAAWMSAVATVVAVSGEMWGDYGMRRCV